MRDYQRTKVYNWEFTWLDKPSKSSMTKEAATEFINRVCSDYGCCVPNIEIPTRGSSARGGVDRVVFPFTWALSPVVILHELSHHMTDLKYGRNRHGPYFVGVFIDLLNRYLNWDTATLIESAKLEKIDTRPLYKGRLV